jgi:NAD(P)-dependent dehydrogenase (short-subunit alcohol dehydrogenase family)
MGVLPQSTFADQVAIVTGGGTGLGFGIAERLGRLGARLVLVSRNPEHVGPAADRLRNLGIEAIGIPTDVRQPDQVERMVATSPSTPKNCLSTDLTLSWAACCTGRSTAPAPAD